LPAHTDAGISEAMTTLLPPAADFGFVDAASFLGVLRSCRKVPQGRLNKIFRHDGPDGFRIWIGGPRFAVRPESLTMMMVLAHDATVPIRLAARAAPEPPSAAWLRMTVEIPDADDMPLVIEVPHTRVAATLPLPAGISMALSGSIIDEARWYDDPDHFAREQPDPNDAAGVAPRSAQSLVDGRLFGFDGDGAVAIVSGIVESSEPSTSSLWGELTTIRLRTAFDIPVVVWCMQTDHPPPTGAVFDGKVALCGSSPDLE
jgi:hypothetical protein